MKNKKKILILTAAILSLCVIILAGTKFARNSLQSNISASSSDNSVKKNNNIVSKDNGEKNKIDSADKTPADAASSAGNTDEKKNEESNKSSAGDKTAKKETTTNSSSKVDASGTNKSETSNPSNTEVKPDQAPAKEVEPEKKAELNFFITDDVHQTQLFSKAVEFDGAKSLEDYTKEFAGNSGSYFNNGYVVKMFNLKEKSAGPLSGWVYYVNGVKPGYGMRDCYPKKGDKIQWKFVEDGLN